MAIFSEPLHLSAARTNFHASYVAGFGVHLLPSQTIGGGGGGGAVVPLIFKGHETEFRLFIIAIIFTFVTSLSALVVGDNSTVARFCIFCSVLTMVLAVSVLAYVFLPDFFRYLSVHHVFTKMDHCNFFLPKQGSILTWVSFQT